MRDALYAYLASHGRIENRVTNGVGHQFVVFCGCGLCDAARDALDIDDTEYEVVRDSNPPERLVD